MNVVHQFMWLVVELTEVSYRTVLKELITGMEPRCPRVVSVILL